ncbi:MAG: hypothetical protein JXX14_08025 [Deltaproteobacteria bacterium]|nr:hypothetical protein [Deltaproteobacteria bacterium]
MTEPMSQPADGMVTAQQIQIETHIHLSPVTIRGDRMVSDNAFSNVTIEGNVHLDMPPMGEVSCERLELIEGSTELRCEGNVRGQLNVPGLAGRNGGPP